MMTDTQNRNPKRREAMISFKVTADEAKLIGKIAARAVKLAQSVGVQYEFLEADMDLSACHANGNPLRLADLLAADDANFGHDVFGIRRYIDRKTGKLTDCFSPRFSQRQ
jgi:hypothetical protein